MKTLLCFLGLMFLGSKVVLSQVNIAKSVILDSVIVAAKSKFDTEDFIEMVKEDTSFYKAFKNLRCLQNYSISELQVFDRQSSEKASFKRRARQHVVKNRMWIDVESEKVNGKLYKKNGKHKYYTAEMFDHIFFPEDTSTVSNILGLKNDEDPDGKNEKNKDKLKILIFNPGAEVGGVPLVGKKMAIFDPKMVEYYDYKISKENYQDTISCYVFSCTAKEGKAQDKTVIKHLKSYFDRSTFNVVSRTYELSYKSLLFDFNVKIYVDLVTKDGFLVPEMIRYGGFWDIPGQRPEVINFLIKFKEFELPATK